LRLDFAETASGAARLLRRFSVCGSAPCGALHRPKLITLAVLWVCVGGAVHAPSKDVKPFAQTLSVMALPIAAFLATACGGAEQANGESYVGEREGRAAEQASSPLDSAFDNPDASTTEARGYRGPTVGAALGFAVLAHSAISSVNTAPVTGNLGVSGATTESITGFDALPTSQYGIDSSSPNSLRTILTQREVEALVDDIDVRACDVNYEDIANAGSAQGITLRPGVTCLNGSDAELLLQGRVTLDAGGDPNAFFVIRSNSTLRALDETVVVLENGAQACGVFWRVNQQVTIGKDVEFLGTVIAGSGIVMQAGSTLVGRALAQTAAVTLDGNSITIPVYDALGSALTCSHAQ
jgi:hypothetical protein